MGTCDDAVNNFSCDGTLMIRLTWMGGNEFVCLRINDFQVTGKFVRRSFCLIFCFSPIK